MLRVVNCLRHEKLRTLLLGVIGGGDRVALGPLVSENLKVIAALKGLVSKEVDLIEITSVQEAQAVRLVPAGGKDIERDLTADAVREVEVLELLLHGGDHVLADVVLQIELLVVIALLARAVPANGGDVEHTRAELDEGTTLSSELPSNGHSFERRGNDNISKRRV